MECWTTPDDGILVRLEAPEGCSSEVGDEIFILLDAWGDIDRLYRDDSEPGDESECRTSYEVEDECFVAIVEERFEIGRTNFSREIEIDGLEPLAEEDAPDEDDLRERLAAELERD